MAADIVGSTWRINYGELNERQQFRVGYLGSQSYEAYFPIDQLADLISVLTGVASLGLNVLQIGSQTQARKVSTGAGTDVIVEPRSATFPPPTMRYRLSDNADLVATLTSFQAQAAGLSPDDWDGSKPTPISYAALPSALSPDQLSATFAPVGGLLWYDDFSRYADGSIADEAPLIGAGTWETTGAQPPVVSDGALVSSGVGYAYTELSEVADMIVAEIEWVSPTSAQAPLALAWVTGETFTLDNLTNHANIGPSNEYTTVKRGATFYPLFPQRTWRSPMVAGQRYIVTVAKIGNQVMVAANGDIHSSPSDPRVSELAGRFVFWEPLTAGGSSVKIHRVAAFKHSETDMFTALSRLTDVAGMGSQRGTLETAVGSPYRASQVSLGEVGQDGQPRVEFGASEVRTTVATAGAAGATALILGARMPHGTVISVNPGLPGSETVTTTGYPTGTGPYTHTVSALANAHAAGEVVSGAVASNRRTSMHYNVSNAYFYLPDLPIVIVPGDNLYLGDQVDTLISRAAAGVVYVPMLRTGRGATGARPAAAAAGQGSQWYDTTLGKPIWSDGAVWRDAAGTSV